MMKATNHKPNPPKTIITIAIAVDRFSFGDVPALDAQTKSNPNKKSTKLAISNLLCITSEP